MQAADEGAALSASPPQRDPLNAGESICKGSVIRGGTLRHVVRHVFRSEKDDALTSFLHGYRFVAPHLFAFSMVLTACRQYCTAAELLSEVGTLVTEHVELNLIRISELDERLFKFIQQWLLLCYQRDFHTSASRRRLLLALMARISSLELRNQLKLHLLRVSRRSSAVPTRTASTPCNGSVVMAWSEVLRESNSIERTHSPVCRLATHTMHQAQGFVERTRSGAASCCSATTHSIRSMPRSTALFSSPSTRTKWRRN